MIVFVVNTAVVINIYCIVDSPTSSVIPGDSKYILNTFSKYIFLTRKTILL